MKKTEKRKTREKDRHYRKKFDWSFPHIRTAFVVSLLAIISLGVAVALNNSEAFWSSIFANIFAGLLTGLVICVVSGSKQRLTAELENECKFLKGLHKVLFHYINGYGELLCTSFERAEDPDKLYEQIYDVGARATNAMHYITQGQFKKELSFEPCEYCKKQFNFDAENMIQVCLVLRGNIMQSNNPPKNELLKQFTPVDRPLRKLNGLVLKRIEELEVRIDSIDHSLI